MLKEEVIANKGYVVFRMEEGDQADDIAIEVLKQDCPDFLLSFNTINIDGETEFRYELTDGIRMSYQQPKISKREFVQQMITMLLPLKSCSDWMLNYHCFCLEPQYIFINAKEQAIRFIYLPLCNKEQSDKEIKDFFINYALSVELQDDKEFILEILRKLRDEHSHLFAVLDFLQSEAEMGRTSGGTVRTKEKISYHNLNKELGVQKETVKENVDIHKDINYKNDIWRSETASEKSLGQNSGDISSSNQFGKSNLEEDLMKNLYGKNKSEEKEKKKRKRREDSSGSGSKKGLFGGIIKKKEKNTDFKVRKAEESSVNPAIIDRLSAESMAPVPGNLMQPFNIVNDDMALSDCTELFGAEYEEQDETVIRLRLENGMGYAAPENIELDMKKGFITVGRYDKSGHPCADFNFDHSLTFVSRNHFRIERRAEGFKIIDLDSKNGTLLNGKELVKNIPYDLNSGDSISISSRVRLTYRVL